MKEDPGPAQMVPARDPTLRVTTLDLLRHAAFWAAAAALAGSALGFVGTLTLFGLIDSYPSTSAAEIFGNLTMVTGMVLAPLSLLGISALIGERYKIGRILFLLGSILLFLFIAAIITFIFYFLYYTVGPGTSIPSQTPLPLLERSSIVGFVLLPSVVVLPFAAGALLRRWWRPGALLLGLCAVNLPLVYLFPTWGMSDSFEILVLLFGGVGVGMSLLEACLWGLLGAMLYRTARKRTLDKAARNRAAENLQRARHLYAEGLGGDLSVLDGLVPEEFINLRHGTRGKDAMKRFVQSLRASFPDLEVSIEDQSAEEDLVKTCLTLSGTDRGGVLWYPPTGRRATFTAEFIDRFRDGELIEHGGETDTKGLLRQLGSCRTSQQDTGRTTDNSTPPPSTGAKPVQNPNQ